MTTGLARNFYYNTHSSRTPPCAAHHPLPRVAPTPPTTPPITHQPIPALHPTPPTTPPITHHAMTPHTKRTSGEPPIRPNGDPSLGLTPSLQTPGKCCLVVD